MAVSNNPFLNAELQQINMQPQPAFGALGNWLSDTLRGDEPLPTTGGWKGHGAAPVRPDTTAGEAAFDAGIHDMFQGELAFNKPFEDAEAEGAYGVPSTGRDLGQRYPVAQQAGTAVKSTKPPVEPGVIAPDPGMDPAGNLAAKNANIAAGAGNVHGQVKPAPDTSLSDVRAAIFKDLGQKTVYETTEDLEPWYESPTFYRGLISFGLNLLSGNDLGASFNQAGKYYDQERGRELREMWRDDLLSDGYNEMEVQRYIESGDNKVLTDPMERQKQLMDMEAGQLGLDKARWEASHRDEDRQREIDKEKREEERQIRKDALSEQLTKSSIAENEAQTQKTLGLTGGELGSGDLNREYKVTSQSSTDKQLWANFRAGNDFYNQYYGGKETGERDFLDAAIDRAGISEATMNKANMDELVALLNPEDRARVYAQMGSVLPLLRKESGSAIGASEYRTKLGILFSLPSENPDQIHAKALNRFLEGERLNPGLSPEARRALSNRTNIKNAFIDRSTGDIILEYLHGGGERFKY